jgi:hypothetical protein
MPSGSRKSKLTFRRIVAPEPISASTLDTAERILARFVALSYVGDHSGLFTPGAEEPPDAPTLPSSEVTSVARAVSAAEVTQYE